MLMLLVFAGGCGKGGGTTPETTSPPSGSGEAGEEGDKEQSMGRYL